MRTTLDIDEAVLLAAKELAAQEGRTSGQVLSDLARRGINAPRTARRPARVVNGFEVLAAGGRVMTPELVHRLFEDSEDA
jgi:hypothetical protein